MVRKLMLSLIFLASSVAVQAQVVRTFVSTTGSDANPCSRTAPCRQFAAALAAVDAGGEVVALDSGGYGQININKEVAINAPPGVHVAIAPTTLWAVLVDTPSDVPVAVKGLTLTGMGASVGVQIVSGAVVLENLSISRFDDGIAIYGGLHVLIANSTLRQGGASGSGVYVYAALSADPSVVVDSCRITEFEIGVWNENSEVLVRNSVITSTEVAVAAFPNLLGTPTTFVEDCALYRNGQGVYVDEGSTTTELQFGTIFLSNTLIAENNIGVNRNTNSGLVYSFGNNRIQQNGVNIDGLGTLETVAQQ